MISCIRSRKRAAVLSHRPQMLLQEIPTGVVLEAASAPCTYMNHQRGQIDAHPAQHST